MLPLFPPPWPVGGGWKAEEAKEVVFESAKAYYLNKIIVNSKEFQRLGEKPPLIEKYTPT